jgi:thymidylate kinase
MDDSEAWIKRFENRWLANGEDPVSRDNVDSGPITSGEENFSSGDKESDKWFEKFAELWLTKKTNLELKDESKNAAVMEKPEGSSHHIEGVLSELNKGGVVIGDSFLHSDPKGKSMETDFTELFESDLNPDDVIVFDIDPEMAINWWKASKNAGM